MAVLLAAALPGCTSSSNYQEIVEPPKKPENAKSPGTAGQTKPPENAEPLLLREGDVIRIAFPGAPNLNTTQQVRRDGKINLSLVGEVPAAGLTTGELEKQLVKLYSGQLNNKEIIVALESSSFPVFVTGAVLRPGRINSDRPISALEAIMEAGGFDYTKANLKKVRVIRESKGQIDNITLDLKRVIEGEDSKPFYVKPHDIIFVPEKFSWF